MQADYLLIDETGRVGIITERRDSGIFARPAGVGYVVESVARVGIPGKLITATYWTRGADGSYRGAWYDDAPEKFFTAYTPQDAEARGVQVNVASLLACLGDPGQVNAQTGGRHQRVNWSAADWSKSNRELAAWAGVSVQAVNAARRRWLRRNPR